MPEARTYVALVRGINVGGNKQVRMADLRRWLEQIGLQQVRTYVQSGNAVFESRQAGKAPAAAIAKEIEKKIEKQAGFAVRVIVRSAEELKKVLSRNTFLRRAGIDAARLHVTFLAGKSTVETRATLAAIAGGGDEMEAGESEIFLHCPNGYGSSKLTNNRLEKAAGVAATTRNWRTVNALCELCARPTEKGQA